MAKPRKANENKIREIKEIINTMPPVYVIFDIETTGFSYAGGDRITEIGAVKLELYEGNYVITDTFSELINPETYKLDEEGNPTNELIMSKRIIELTGITPEMLIDKPNYEVILPKFHDFVKDAVLVAHNASFDVTFVKFFLNKMGQSFSNHSVDTLEMARDRLTELTSHKLNLVCDHLGIVQENHHRAVDDCRVTSLVFLNLMSHYKVDQMDIFSYDGAVDNSLKVPAEKAEEILDEVSIVPVEETLFSIESAAYWAKGSHERIYINTDKGKCFFDLLGHEIGMMPWHLTLECDLPTFEEEVLKFMELSSMDEFSKFRGKKYKKIESPINHKENITKEIIRLSNEYIESGLAKNACVITDELSEEFAYQVQNNLLKTRAKTGILIFSIYDFMSSEKDGPDNRHVFDLSFLNKRPNIVPISGLSWDDMAEVLFEPHVWMYFDGLCFDAECPEGVLNFFELPFYKRAVNDYLSPIS